MIAARSMSRRRLSPDQRTAPQNFYLTVGPAPTNRAGLKNSEGSSRPVQSLLKGRHVAKPELGSKQKCLNCGTKFFDLNKNPIVCPKCGASQVLTGPATSGGAAREVPASDEDEPEVEGGAEVLSLDDADQVEDGKVAAISPDDEIEEDEAAADDDDAFLEPEEDDSGDVSDLIDGDLEDDEER